MWWAEASLMAAWWLLWGGYGEQALARWRIGRRAALVGLALIWGAGWVRVLPIPAWGPVDLGLILVTGLAAAVLVRAGRQSWMLAAGALGLLAGVVRGLAPINPEHPTFMPWVGGEAAALGLMAAAITVEPVGGAAVAVGGAALADLLRLYLHPVPNALYTGDWLYTVLAALMAWLTASVLRRPLPVTPG